MKEGLIEFHGPFGNYPWGTSGAILNAAVRQENLPLSRVEDLSIGDYDVNGVGSLYYRKDLVCQYRWIDGISTPLFKWRGEFGSYNQHKFIVQEDKKLKPCFRLSLSNNGMAAFEISGSEATPSLHRFLKRMMTNLIGDPCYKIHQNAGAFFQGGAHDPNGHWFLVEFWKPEGAEAFIKYLNENCTKEEI